MKDFVFNGRATRVVFGPGSLARLEAEMARLGSAGRALVLCTPQQRDQAEALAARLGERAAGVFDRAEMHVPIEVAREAGSVAERLGADCTLALGGGSTIGLGKAIALASGLPIIAVPTTYAGSEMTPIYGLTENGTKRTGTDLIVMPKVVIYDPELSLTLPAALSITSGINAIAHAAEGLYAQDANPITSLMAEEGIGALVRALPAIHRDPADRAARGEALYGAWLCGSVLGAVGMALHHKLCHTLGGSFGLPHAETHTVVLPHALAFNYRHAPEAMARIERAFAAATPAPLAVHRLADSTGAPTSLAQLGLQASDLDRAADIAMSNPYFNPRPLEHAALRALLQRAFDGAEPVVD